MKLLIKQARQYNFCAMEMLNMSITWMKFNFDIRKNVLFLEDIELDHITALTLRRMLIEDKAMRGVQSFRYAYYKTIDNRIQSLAVGEKIVCCLKHEKVSSIEMQREELNKKEVELKAKEANLAQREAELKKANNSLVRAQRRHKATLKRRKKDSDS